MNPLKRFVKSLTGYLKMSNGFIVLIWELVSVLRGRSWEKRAKIFNIHNRVKGKSFLDVGAMEGGDTFAAEDAKAARITAFDVDNYFQYDLRLNAV
jgi:hypothetical protein